MSETLWKIEHVAQFLQVSEAQAARIAVRVGFPKAVVLPSTGKGERSIRRWIPSEVWEWVDTQREAA